MHHALIIAAKVVGFSLLGVVGLAIVAAACGFLLYASANGNNPFR